MKTYSMMLNARNKAKHVAAAVKSMFLQVGPAIELLLSDSGSTDGTREILDDLARTYNGPHKVRRLNCPCADTPGMPGLNSHINWCMTQTEADVVMQLSADDYDLAQRSQLTIAAFEEHNPSMVLAGMYYVSEDMKYLGETPWPDKSSWCVLEEMYPKFVGGSTCQAWTHEFFDEVGGLEGVGSPDVVLPFLACLADGAYFVHTRCHAYRKCIGLQNTGLEGVWASYPEGSKERLQLEELMHFQVMAGHYSALGKLQRLDLPEEVLGAATHALAQAILDRSASWINTRQRMSFDGVPPRAFTI